MNEIFTEDPAYWPQNYQQTEPLTVDYVLTNGKRDRYALIIPPAWEQFVNDHLAEIMPEARVTGILVEEYAKGSAIHCTDPVYIPSILANGIDVCENDEATFGAGLLYCWPLDREFPPNDYEMLEIEYEGRLLRSIAIEDVDPRDEFQICLFADAIKKVTRLGHRKETSL